MFSVDLVADPAIRHENGKQVARWNVDIYGQSPSTGGDSSDHGGSPPNSGLSTYGGVPIPLFGASHPAARGHYSTGQHAHARNPNGGKCPTNDKILAAAVYDA